MSLNRITYTLVPRFNFYIISCFRKCSNASIKKNTDIKWTDFSNLRTVAKTTLEYNQQKSLKLSPEDQPKSPQLLKVAILGVPNSGKSTLTNQLIGWRVCPVSKKVHTTRNNATAIMMAKNTQIVFLDTPGLVSSEQSIKHYLEPSMVNDSKDSLKYTDVIVVIIDISNQWTRRYIEPVILELLETHKDKISVLILNKCDLIKSKQILLSTTRKLTCNSIAGQEENAFSHSKSFSTNENVLLEKLFLQTENKIKKGTEDENHIYKEYKDTTKGWPNFSAVFMVSAIDGDGIDKLRDFLIEKAYPHSWLYHPSVVTDQSPQDLAMLTVRQNLLNELNQEIPYNLKINIELWELEDSGFLKIVMNVTCPKKNLIKQVIGRSGERISRIVNESKQDLSNIFRCDVILKIDVR